MASDAQSVINGLVTAFQKVLTTHQTEMKKIVDQTSNRKSLGVAGKTVRDLSRRAKVREYELKQAEKGLEAAKELDDAFQELAHDIKDNNKNYGASQRKTVASIDRLVSSTNTLDKTQVNEITRLRDMISRGQDVSSSLSSLSKILDSSLDGESKNYESKLQAVKVQDHFSRSIVSLTEGTKGLISRFFSLSTAVGLLGEGIVREFGNIEVSLKNQVPSMDLLQHGFFNLSDSAIRYGLSVKDVQDAQNNYRQTLLAASGPITDMSVASKKLMDSYRVAGDEFYNVTGNVHDSIAQLSASLNLLSFQGVKMSMEELTKASTGPDGLRSHLQQLSLMTGQSYDTLAKMNTQMMSNSDMQMTLLGIDKKRKKGFVDELLNRQAYLVSQGMEIEQANQATAAFAKLTTTVSPKDRYKEAARLTALGSAMGVNTKGLMGAMMNPNDKGSQEIASRFATSMQTALSNHLNSHNIGQQMLGGAIQEKAAPGMAMIQGLSTAGMEPRAISADTMNAIKDMSQKMATPLTGIQGDVADIHKWLSQAGNILSDPVVSILGGVVSALGSIGKTLLEILTIQSVMKGESLLGGIGKTLGLGGMAGTAGRLGGMAIGTGGILGAATTAGGVGLAGAGGYAIGSAINEIPKLFGSDSNLGEIIGSKIYDWFGDKVKIGSSIAAPVPGSSTDPVVAQKQLTEVITNLTNALTQNNDLTSDQQTTINDQIKIAKQHIETLKQNTDATKTNTQIVQTDNASKMTNTDPIS